MTPVSTSNGLLHVLAHGLGLLTDQLAVEGSSSAVGADDTSEHLKAGLNLAGVASDDIAEGVQASVQGSAGNTDGSLGLLAVGGDGLGVLGVGVLGLELNASKLAIQTLGSLGEVASGLNPVLGSMTTDLGELASEELVEGTHLLSGSTLVLVEQSTELATGTDGCGVAVVGQLSDAGKLSLSATVHTELDGLVASNLAGHNSDLTREAGLLVLNGSGGAGNSGGESLTSIGHLLGSLGTGSGNVLHGLREARVSESSLLGNAIVDALDRGSEGRVGRGTVAGHVHVELAKLGRGTTLGSSHGTRHSLKGSTETGGRLSVGTVDGALRGSTGAVDLGDQGSHVGLHGSINILCLLREGIGVSSDLVVGLLDLLGSLGLEGQEGTVHGTDGILELTLGSLLGSGDGTGNSGTASGVLAGSMGLLGVGHSESNLGDLHRSDEVLLSLGSSGADSVQELTTHLGASLGGGETEVLNLGGRLLGELGHLRGDTHVQGSLGLLVHVLELLLSLHHADLTLVDGTLDGSLKLHLVGLHDSGQLGAALGVLDSVGADNASELVHLALELLVVADNVAVESSHALGEVGLGSAELVSDVETGVTGLGSELAVDLHLGLLGLSNGSVQLASLLGEHVGSVGTVLLHGGTNLVELSAVVVSHGLEAGIGGSLVLLDKILQLGVLLKVLLVALVTDLDHAVHLGAHVGVDLGLLELVLVDNTSQLGDTSIGLGDLLLHSGTEKVDLGLELGTGR